MLGPQPDRIAGREPQVVEVDLLGHRDAHADAVARRRLLVDDPQVRERDAERDALGERPPAALERDPSRAPRPLGPPGGREGVEPVAASPTSASRVDAYRADGHGGSECVQVQPLRA